MLDYKATETQSDSGPRAATNRIQPPSDVMSRFPLHASLIRERVLILTDRELIEGTICYAEGIRLSDALNSASAQLSKPHLPLVDATVTRVDTGQEVLRCRFLLVARSKIVVLLPKSELAAPNARRAADSEAGAEPAAEGPHSEAAAPWGTDVSTLVAAMSAPDEAERRHAAEGLGRLGTRAAAAIPALLECLKDRDDLVRGQCAEALGNIGHDGSEVVAALRGLLKDRSEFVRRMAAGALGDLGATSGGTVGDLSDALTDEEEFVRRAAAALGKIGPPALEAAPALQAALADSDVFVRHWATVALNKILGPGAPQRA